MPPKITVEKSGSTYYLRSTERAGLDEMTLQQKFIQVFSDVNPAAKMQRNAAGYQDAFNRGPVLFQVAVQHPQTGATSSQLGGLQVSEDLLASTLAKLRELGFEIIDRR